MRALLVCLALALSACGGGGGSAPAPTPAPLPEPVTLRTDLFYGYFGVAPNSIRESFEHINLAWIMDWGDSTSAAGRAAISAATFGYLNDARAAGVNKAVVGISYLVYNTETSKDDLRLFFVGLQAANFLNMLVAVYPIDEPDTINGLSAERIGQVNADIRSVMGEFFELRDTAIAVIYGDRGFKGMEFYDWVGFDRYGEGDQIFTNGRYASLKASLRADQKSLLVPGGAQPWLTDPHNFYVTAENDHQVAAIVPFMWIDRDGALGIRSASTKHAYCLVGKKIKTPEDKNPVCA